ncbi:MAG: hypothetical protein ACK55H_08130 [Cyanobacteriota bacterium]
MPYSSNIQVVNDANGTAYAFLADNGLLWQCQWNAEAQRWDKGQIVPGAQGGEGLAALYVKDFWPNGQPSGAGGGAGTNPGIVLAYRVGRGSGAEIHASFGTWGSDGQLSWAAPIALTDDEAEEQQFSLGDGGGGQFNLVVQKQLARDTPEQLLEQAAALSASTTTGLKKKVEDLAIGNRPDQDLYQTTYSLERVSNGGKTAINLITADGGVVVGTITATEQPTAPRTAMGPSLFNGNTQLTRAAVLSRTLNPEPQPALLGRSGLQGAALGDASAGSFKGLLGIGVSPGNGNFGSFSLGLSLFPARYLVVYQAKADRRDSSELSYHQTEEGERSFQHENGASNHGSQLARPEGFTQSLRKSETIYKRTSSMGNVADHPFRALSQSLRRSSYRSTQGGFLKNFFYHNSDQNPVWIMTGLVGSTNFGAGSTVVNFSKFERGRVKRGGSILSLAGGGVSVLGDAGKELKNTDANALPDELRPNQEFTAAAVGGTQKSVFQYQNGFTQNQATLKGYEARQSVGASWVKRKSIVKIGSFSSQSWVAAVNTGILFEETYTPDLRADGRPMPQWLTDVGYSLAAEGALLTMGGPLFGVLKRNRVSPVVTQENALTNTRYDVSGVKTQALKFKSYFNMILGIGNGFVVPAVADTVMASTYGTSAGGIGINMGLSADFIRISPWIVGVKGIATSQTSMFFTGSDPWKVKELAYASIGAAAPFGIYVPILSFHYTSQPADTTTAAPLSGIVDGDASGAMAADTAPAQTSSGFYQAAPSGVDYPLLYNPPHASNNGISNLSTNPSSTTVLGTTASPLFLFTLQPGASTSSPSPGTRISIRRPGSGLKPTEAPVQVDVLGTYLDPTSSSNRATASVTVDASGQLASVVINNPGRYSYLPETGNNSGEYILQLDLAAAGLSTPASKLPLVTLPASSSALASEGLLTSPVLRISNQPIAATDSNLQTAPDSSYPIYDSKTNTAVDPQPNSLASYSYQNVPIQLFARNADGSSGSPISLINPNASARVFFSEGSIKAIRPEQNLYFPVNQKATNGYNLVVNFGAYGAQVDNPTLADLPSASISLPLAESVAYNNAVAEEQFSPQAGAIHAGVYLADGMSDAIPLFPAYGNQAVYNRVVHLAYDKNTGTTTRFFLNADDGNVYEPNYINQALNSNTPLPSFSAASQPVALTIADAGNGSNDRFGGDTFVAWVEATQPVVPLTSADGEQNYQAFLQALYGSQRINYRIKQSISGWAPMDDVKLDALYKPDNAMIRQLRAFNAANPFTSDSNDQLSLLAWVEVPLPGQENQAASLKVAILNPTASNYSWEALTSNAEGASTISTIPWQIDRHGEALAIDDLSIGSMPLELADGDGGSTLVQTPVLSFSRDVRTPYRQRVLNDSPLLYLPFDGLTAGLNELNLGTTQGSITPTFASSTGLDFSVKPALTKSQGTAVQNTNGTGVLTTGLGTSNRPMLDLLDSATSDELAVNLGSQISAFTGEFSNRVVDDNAAVLTPAILTVSDLRYGGLSVGDTLTGPGITPGTRILAVKQVYDDTTKTGIYEISADQTVLGTAIDIQSYPDPTTIAYLSFAIDAVSNSSDPDTAPSATLTLSDLSGVPRVGDRLAGLGITPGTTITAVNGLDLNQGTATVTVNRTQDEAAATGAAVVAAPGGSSPYTIEFWAKLTPNTNSDGGGLVAFGQPSATAVGDMELPNGWLLTSSFVVDFISYKQAAERGLIESIPDNVTNNADLYAWGWSVVADGANTTAMNGSGGNNLYSNGLRLNNLQAGNRLNGVASFLQANGLQPDDLIGKSQAPADVMASIPKTELQFAHFIDPAPGKATSNLNTVAINTSSSTALNQGLVVLNPASTDSGGATYPDWAQVINDTAKGDQINTLFKHLWNFQQATGDPKVTFTQAPLGYRMLLAIQAAWPSLSVEAIKDKLSDPGALAQFIADSGVVATPAEAAAWLEAKELELNQTRASAANPLSVDRFAGYELGYTLNYGPAVSVNTSGQLVFDVGADASLVSDVAGGLEDDQWHYVVASYLPDYVDYTTDAGTTFQLPSNVGTATLYIDNKQASQSTIVNAYDPSNINDALVLLANNAGAAIDHLALYDNALTAQTLPPASDDWPMPNNAEALLALRELGMVIDTKTPDPGAIPGAVTAHWDGRNVNPNNAVLNTFYSIFSPATNGSQSGSWSEASPLNPLLAVAPTTPSAVQPDAGRNSLLLSITPELWSSNSWAVTTATNPTPQTDKPFNPSGLELDSVQLQINGAPVTLTSDQILIGNATLASLQPDSRSSQLNYTILSSTPELTLVPPLDRSTVEAVSSEPTTATLVYSNGTSVSIALTPALTSNANTQPLASAVRVAKLNNKPLLTEIETSNEALGTSAIIEQAPLQLKYIDSGEVFRSTTSAATANETAASTPAQSFGYSQVSGSFANSTEGTSSGWLAIAQPYTTNATSDPSGRIWIQYTGQFKVDGEIRTAVLDVDEAPATWLNALADSNFSPEEPNLPLLDSAVHRSSSGGLLIQADPTVGLDQNFGFTMLTARINGSDRDDLIIAAPQADGGGKVYIIDGNWIANNLTTANGATILNLANPSDLGDFVKVLKPGIQTDTTGKPLKSDVITDAGFGTALAYDDVSKTLWIGAPNYLRNLSDPTSTDGPLNPIGALYSYNLASGSGDSGTATPVKLEPIVGMGGTLIRPGPVGTPVTSYWGSQFGSALAVSGGRLAVSAPGMLAATLAIGSEAAQQIFVDGMDADTTYSGVIAGVQLPDLDTGIINISQGINSDFAGIGSGDPFTDGEKAYFDQMRTLVSDAVAEPTIYNNQAVQADAAGAVFYLGKGDALLAAPSLQTFAEQGSIYYGPNTLNTLGAAGFGSSVAFIDLSNVKTPSLAVGADATGGAGAVYLIDPNVSATNLPVKGLNPYQKLAANEAYLTLTGAASRDLFGNGLVNLGDVNQDSFDDLLIQAKNAAEGAGTGYVLFGSDQFSSDPGKSATGSVAPGSITQFTRTDGTPFRQAILVEQGYGSGFTGAGSFGSGDIDADGLNDIQLGSGPNGNAYLTWGKPYLEAIGDLSLSKLASDTGYLLSGLATTTEGSLRSIGDFNADGYDDFISIQPGQALSSVRIELGADTQTILADYRYNYYTFSILNGTQVISAGDVNGDGYADIALFSHKNLSSAAEGNQGAGSTTGILYGRSSTDLPIGSGFGLLAPVNPTSGAPLTALPGLLVEGSNQLKGLTSATPALIADGTTLYTAVKGATDNTIWFNISSDGGATWANWTNLSAVSFAFNAADGAGPSLALHNGKLYLSFLNRTGKLLLSSWDPSSEDNSAWTQPTLLTSAAAASTEGTSAIPFSSSYSPQLIDRGDALGILWVDPTTSTLYAAASTDPQDSVSLGWNGDIGGSTPTTPALAQIGDTIYMAVQGNGPANNEIYWNSSQDGGTTWAGWRALDSGLGFRSSNAPSLAVFKGELYLSCIDASTNQIRIANLDRSSNSWAAAGTVGNEQAQKYASLISETVDGVEQLAVYFVANNAGSTLLKSHSSDPGSPSGWTGNQVIDYNNGSNQQTASGPLAVSSINGTTVIAYQGGTVAAPSDTIFLASSATPNSSASWRAQSYIDPKQRTTPSLTTSPEGLLLGYTTANSANLELALLANASGTWQSANTYSVTRDNGDLNDVALLAIPDSDPDSSDDNTLLLAGVNTTSGNAIETNRLRTVDDSSVDDSWTPASQLLERIEANGEISFSGIAATAAPTATWLGDVPIVAVNNTVDATSTINVYSVGGSTQSWTLASSFTASGDQPAISAAAPGLTTTDSGIALTYINSDRSITVNQLNLLNLNGTPVDGLQFNADGSLTPSPGQPADLRWSGSTYTAANSGISSNLSSTPIDINGTLLLANVRPDGTPEETQFWLNALPAAQDPDSTTWLNTTLQLSDGSGGWLVQQQGGADHPVAIGVVDPTWQQPNGGLSPWAPSFAEVDGVLYSAVRGWSGSNDTNKTLYWNRSTDNGSTWSAWQQLPGDMTSDRPPTIASYDGTLYLVYIGQDNSHTLNLTKLENADTNQWADQIPIRAGASGASNQTAEFATLVSEGDQLALYYVGTDKNELYSTSSTDPYNTGNFTTSTLIKYNNNNDNQTASGPLAATRLNGQTYLAYQGGTYQSGNNKPGKSNQIFLTTGSANDNDWTLINGIPQPANSSHTGVGLAANHTGLVLSYSDVADGKNVVALQQGRGSGPSWSFSPYTMLERPADGQALYDGANSLFARTGSEGVLVSTIDSIANEAIVNAQVTPLPPSLVLTPEQTRSTLTAVGDLTGDGLDDLLISAANVVRTGNGSTAPQLHTGIRLLSGAATSEALLAANNADATNQTLQLAPALSLNSGTPSTSLTATGAPGDLPQLSISGREGDVVTRITSKNDQTLTKFSANASNPDSLLQLFQNAEQDQQTLNQGQGWGQAALNSSGAFGDLNGDGWIDLFDPAGNNTIASVQGAGYYSLWSIRAAGDANGNGVDDVLLALSPNGPAYGQIVSGQPSALQAVLVDGSLFKVDKDTNSFRLDQLWVPLNPYNTSQLYDINSTTPDVYLPSLQNWFDPILSFQPGSLTAASTTNPINPRGAMSYSPPSAVVSPEGQTYLFFSGADFSGTDDASGLWMAYKDDAGSWQQMVLDIDLDIGSNCNNTTPSAAYFKGKLYVAYTDTNQNINIAVCSGSPDDTKNWSGYQVVTTTNESTIYSPTLLEEAGRLALYFPTNNKDGLLINAQSQRVRYLYSLDPGDKSAHGHWGASLDSSTGQYSGISGQLDYEVTSAIAATRFQGQTVLAFRSFASGGGYDAGNGTIKLLTSGTTAPTATAPAPTLSWKEFDTAVSNVNGVGLSTDQALLYLTTSKNFNDPNPTSKIWGLAPNDLASGTWTMGGQTTLSNPSLFNENSAESTFSDDVYFGATVVPFMENGSLMAAWTDHDKKVQVADLSTTVSLPRQSSLVGFSLDGNSDINGDGFMDVLVSDPSDPSQSVNNQYALFGGDYLNIASQVGTPGDDALIGTPLADVIYTLGGTDVVQSLGGADVILTGSGDDQIAITGPGFLRIDAGGGTDQLLLAGLANQDYDFSLNVPEPEYFAGTKLRNIELISSVDYGSNTISLDAAAVSAFNPARILFLTPDSSDHIALSTEFQRNSALDSSYGGVVWSAYSADADAAKASDSASTPALVYVLNPDDGTADVDWLSSHVRTDNTSTTTRSIAPTNPLSASEPVEPALPSPRSSTQGFGKGLSLVAYPTTNQSTAARFLIQRNDSSSIQAVAYNTTSQNATADAGPNYTPATGLVVFQPGEWEREIAIPLNPQSLSSQRASSISLNVIEIPAYPGMRELHSLLSPTPNPSTGITPVVSNLQLGIDESSAAARLSFRVDTNDDGADELRLFIASRDSATDLIPSRSQEVVLRDFKPDSNFTVPVNSFNNLPLDHDARHNRQVSGALGLNLIPREQQNKHIVSLLGPAFRPTPSVETVGTMQLRFQQDTPLTTWRSDTAGGQVTFALQAGATKQLLLSDATGGSAGSINPASALDNNPTSGWQSTESRAVGSRSITTVPNLTAQTWAPTATRDGIELALLELTVIGNQITALFQGGVSAEFWQASGTAPALVPVATSLEVQRLAGYDNTIGLYSIDNITGMVDGRSPGDAGYLQAALARSEAEDLLLTAAELPAFGQSAIFNSLPIDSKKRYGVLLLPNSDPNTIFSCFSAANPGAETQMVRLSTGANRYALGIEDIAVASGRSDKDFNDNILSLSGVSLGIF